MLAARPSEQSWLLALTALSAAGLASLLALGAERLAIAASILSFLSGWALLSRPAAIVAVFVFLAILGDFRRALIPLTGWSSEDPLLLVGPALAVLLFGLVAAGQPLYLNTLLSRMVLALMSVMMLQIFNPFQDGIRVGLAGALFYLVPLLWFWIGRSYASISFFRSVLLRVVVPVATLASLLGIYQAFYGLWPFQRAWVELVELDYTALNVGGYVRPIAFFTSASEYAHYLAIAIALLTASWCLKQGTNWFLLLIPLLALALFLISSRGIIVMVLIVVALLWAVQSRTPVSWLLRLALFTVLVGAALTWSMTQLQDYTGGRVGALVQHQAAGLLNPLDPVQSTAPDHIDMFLNGLAAGVNNPLGNGLGVTTLAASKYGGAGSNTEVDWSNMFVSLGLLGGAIYAGIVAVTLSTALRFWHKTRSLVALAILGLLIVELGQWLNGGHYAVAALIWFSIGALDRFYMVSK